MMYLDGDLECLRSIRAPLISRSYPYEAKTVNSWNSYNKIKYIFYKKKYPELLPDTISSIDDGLNLKSKNL